MQENAAQLCISEREHDYRPRSLLLQWHITERCNLRCAHCYQDCYSTNELPLEILCGILEQYRGMLSEWRAVQPENPTLGHVTVTGGEPFIRSDFIDLLEVLHSHKREFGFAILTNGTFIDRTMARRLRRLRPSFVQVSVEGSRATHDAIRGPGNYDKTVAAIKYLVRAGIRTLMSFTATRMNFREFESVARLGSSLSESDYMVLLGIADARGERQQIGIAERMLARRVDAMLICPRPAKDLGEFVATVQHNDRRSIVFVDNYLSGISVPYDSRRCSRCFKDLGLPTPSSRPATSGSSRSWSYWMNLGCVIHTTSCWPVLTNRWRPGKPGLSEM